MLIAQYRLWYNVYRHYIHINNCQFFSPTFSNFFNIRLRHGILRNCKTIHAAINESYSYVKLAKQVIKSRLIASVETRSPMSYLLLTCVSHAHVIAMPIGWTSVHLSVRHTLVLCRNGSTIVKLSSLPGSHSSFLRTKHFPGIPMGTPQRGFYMGGGRKKLQFPTNISL